jgi:hypothetical protein
MASVPFASVFSKLNGFRNGFRFSIIASARIPAPGPAIACCIDLEPGIRASVPPSGLRLCPWTAACFGAKLVPNLPTEKGPYGDEKDRNHQQRQEDDRDHPAHDHCS